MLGYHKGLEWAYDDLLVFAECGTVRGIDPGLGLKNSGSASGVVTRTIRSSKPFRKEQDTVRRQRSKWDAFKSSRTEVAGYLSNQGL